MHLAAWDRNSRFGRSGGSGRRPYGDEHHFGAWDDFRITACEMKVMLRFFEQLSQVRLIDRNVTPAQSRDFGGVRIEAGHRMPNEGQADAGRETDVAGSNNSYTHNLWVVVI